MSFQLSLYDSMGTDLKKIRKFFYNNYKLRILLEVYIFKYLVVIKFYLIRVIAFWRPNR